MCVAFAEGAGVGVILKAFSQKAKEKIELRLPSIIAFGELTLMKHLRRLVYRQLAATAWVYRQEVPNGEYDNPTAASNPLAMRMASPARSLTPSFPPLSTVATGDNDPTGLMARRL